MSEFPEMFDDDSRRPAARQSDERPGRRKKKSSNPQWLWFGAGGGVLAVVIIVVAVMSQSKPAKKPAKRKAKQTKVQSVARKVRPRKPAKKDEPALLQWNPNTARPANAPSSGDSALDLQIQYQELLLKEEDLEDMIYSLKKRRSSNLQWESEKLTEGQRARIALKARMKDMAKIRLRLQELRRRMN